MKEEIVFTLLELVSGLRLGVNVAQSVASVAFSASKAATEMGFSVAQSALEGGSPVKRIEAGPASFRITDIPYRILGSLLRTASDVSRASISVVDTSVSRGLEVTSWALKSIDELMVSAEFLTPTRSQTGLFRLFAKFLDMVEADRMVLELGQPQASVLQKVSAFRALVVLQKQSRPLRYSELPSVERVDLAVLRAITLEQWVEEVPPEAASPEPDVWYDADETRTIITFVSHQKSFDLVSAEVSSQLASAQKRASRIFDFSGYANPNMYSHAQGPSLEVPVNTLYTLREVNTDEEYSTFLHRCASFALASYGRRYKWLFHYIAGEHPTEMEGAEGDAGAGVGFGLPRSRPVVDVDPEHVLMASSLADLAPKLAKAADDASRAPPPSAGSSTSPKSAERRHPLAYHPTYLLLVDHPTRSIILVLRGTLSFHDVLVDLNSGSAPFPIRHNVTDDDPEGPAEPYLSDAFHVHEGMLEAAKILADPHGSVMAELAKAMIAWREYGVVLVGHSLGGGVAACLAGLLADPSTSLTLPHNPPLPPNRPLHCIAFGPPALVSLPLSLLLRGVPSTHPSGRPRPPFVTSVVVGHDPVPRLCILNIADTARRIGAMLDDPNLASEAVHRARGSAHLGEEGQEWFAEQYRDLCDRARTRVAPIPTMTVVRPLYPPGRVLWLRPGTNGGYGMFDVGDVSEVFGQLEWSAEGMWEHTPGVYERAVAAATSGR
ncbi:alpha/beta-hydrolase [Gonapodya prolifera JEL478]|uniref:sn-1-specific diacylglycerol lipase n=1 Tax=Gonapodya prolifera (strain JEL478) TaxID=1344416 RepID=A0A139A0Q5_GONPJ|nr:alpha/beta-hydrolase [Gonapodya prolifera JEL478]|eukprot:KXS10367.1 alpha/beta-hydrolase [Gonapodya prolifera JEL478]